MVSVFRCRKVQYQNYIKLQFCIAINLIWVERLAFYMINKNVFNSSVNLNMGNMSSLFKNNTYHIYTKLRHCIYSALPASSKLGHWQLIKKKSTKRPLVKEFVIVLQFIIMHVFNFWHVLLYWVWENMGLIFHCILGNSTITCEGKIQTRVKSFLKSNTGSAPMQFQFIYLLFKIIIINQYNCFGWRYRSSGW